MEFALPDTTRHNTSDSTIDSTPISPLNTSSPESYGFTPPDWVMVTSTGPKVLTAPDTTTVGRYAYAIYDEGGLLDANVAGFPVPASTPSSSVAPYPSLKGTLAYADLTVLPGPSASPTPFLQSQVNNLVGWRNFATTQATGSLTSNYAFDSGVPARYDAFLLAMTTGFLTANPSPAPSSNRTDQLFTSRQALLKFRRASGFSQNILQYLGTFSRDIEQPSYVPNPARPRVQNSSTATTGPAPFGYGNAAYGLDTLTSPSTNINPPFLQVRVGAQYTRLDGTTANVGDPLVLKRFPLSRLSLITSSSTNTNSQTDPTKIYPYFGLYRSSSTGTASNWSYNHGNPTGIYRLDQMKALGRDPDFFELLKAAINVGSLGKSALLYYNSYPWDNQYTTGYLQNARDILTDLQILQIGANIIDQSKSDNFPTRIQFSGSPSYEVRGAEDLPYFYQWRNWPMQIGATTGVLLWQPELWNPHSLGSSANVPATATPTNFRFRVALDPTVTTSTPIGLTLYYDNTSGTPHDWSPGVTLDYGNALPAPLYFNAGAANNFWDFREPTLLSLIGVPTGSNLKCTASYNDYTATPYSKNGRTGLVVATFPWINPADNTSSIHNITLGGDPTSTSTDYSTCIHYYLEYEDSSGAWIPYDDQSEQIDGNSTNGMNLAPGATTIQNIAVNTFWGGARTDPRTSRWGLRIAEYL